jgi:hypothetical protein
MAGIPGTYPHPHSEYFIHFLGYAPDPVLSDNTLERFTPAEESPLPIDPELIRVIAPGATNDHAGMGAMVRLRPLSDALGEGRSLAALENSGLKASAPTAVQAAG